LLVANYTEGNVASLAIESNGRLGALLSSFQHVGSSVDDRRQQAPHAHSINLDAANEFAFAADLGIDKVVVYRYEADTGELTDVGAPRSAVLPPGSGPRHFAFHPSGDYAYVINELRSTIEVFRYEPKTGELRSLQNVSTLPDGYSQTNYTAEVVVHPSGKYVYGSNRGHDSIAVFQMNQQSGELTRVQVESTQGKTPRNFVVDPTGNWLLAENQGSDTIVVFAIDAVTGKLTPTGQIVSVPVPVCIRFLSQAK
jgi:6-phosphogluconolactonase